MGKFKTKSLEEKKQEIKNLTNRAVDQVKNIVRTPDDMKEYLQFISKFHQYSANNTMLMNQQFSGAIAVGSFTFWKSKGFSVNKGEKGIKILVPKEITFFKREDKVVQLKNATKEEKEKIRNGEIPISKRIFFDVGHVFDISQTNAKSEDLPKIFPNKWLEGSVKDYNKIYHALEKVAEKYQVEIVEPYEELGSAKGVSYTLLNEIALNPRNGELQNIKTLSHELAHQVLHNSKTFLNYTKQEKEFQAEMVAYTVCSYLGLDTSEYSLNYLYEWTKGKELKDQEKLLHEVQSTAHDFISIIEKEMEKSLEKDNQLDYQELKLVNNDPEKININNILLIKYDIPKVQQNYISFKELVDRVEKDHQRIKSLNVDEQNEDYLEFKKNKLSQLDQMLENTLNEKLFIDKFNEFYKDSYAAINIRKLTRPYLIIQDSEYSKLKPNTIQPFGEINYEIKKLENKYRFEDKSFETNYHVVFPKKLALNNQAMFSFKLNIGEGKYASPYEQIQQEMNPPYKQLQALRIERNNKQAEMDSKEFSGFMKYREKEALKLLDVLEKGKFKPSQKNVHKNIFTKNKDNPERD